ncbi:hypothetical protein VP01_1101g2 [Puccinia sorghi]|uniref:Uncharacterized protein n=1 Tax=Puccinia sorghi TaxID=27349 RepID=A0A0L6VSV3_9BASI|nr:hypothetical protein VP01_1101g2 [Puccinia sorghi]
MWFVDRAILVASYPKEWKDEDSTGWTEGYRKRTEFRDTALRQSRYRPHAQANGRRVALVCLVIVGSQSIENQKKKVEFKRKMLDRGTPGTCVFWSIHMRKTEERTVDGAAETGDGGSLKDLLVTAPLMKRQVKHPREQTNFLLPTRHYYYFIFFSFESYVNLQGIIYSANHVDCEKRSNTIKPSSAATCLDQIQLNMYHTALLPLRFSEPQPIQENMNLGLFRRWAQPQQGHLELNLISHPTHKARTTGCGKTSNKKQFWIQFGMFLKPIIRQTRIYQEHHQPSPQQTCNSEGQFATLVNFLDSNNQVSMEKHFYGKGQSRSHTGQFQLHTWTWESIIVWDFLLLYIRRTLFTQHKKDKLDEFTAT